MKGKQHCNVSNANIGLLEHVQCTCMSDSPKMSIPKLKYKLQTCKNQKFKTIFTDRLIPPFHQSNMQYEFLRILKYG